jgi:hypothetical protein
MNRLDGDAALAVELAGGLLQVMAPNMLPWSCPPPPASPSRPTGAATLISDRAIQGAVGGMGVQVDE